MFGKGGGTGPGGTGAAAACGACGARPGTGAAAGAGPAGPPASGAGARSTLSRHVGHVCCRWNHSRRHAAWNMWLQGNFFAPVNEVWSDIDIENGLMSLEKGTTITRLTNIVFRNNYQRFFYTFPPVFRWSHSSFDFR